jgi:hypothetical protein
MSRNSLIAGTLRLKGYNPYKTHNEEECLQLVEEVGERIDAVSAAGKLTLLLAASGSLLEVDDKK